MNYGTLVIHRAYSSSFEGIIQGRSIKVRRWFAWRPVKTEATWKWLTDLWRVESIEIGSLDQPHMVIEYRDAKGPKIELKIQALQA